MVGCKEWVVGIVDDIVVVEYSAVEPLQNYGSVVELMGSVGSVDCIVGSKVEAGCWVAVE